jgi:DNA end-binding protein Ku
MRRRPYRECLKAVNRIADKHGSSHDPVIAQGAARDLRLRINVLRPKPTALTAFYFEGNHPMTRSMEIASPAPAAPRGRASWSGLLRLSLVAVPVQAYPAVSSTDEVHLNQLHAGCGQRIRYEKRCPVHGPVDASSITRGYQYAPDQYVIVEPEELEQIRPAQDRALTLVQFIEPEGVDLALFSGRTLYLMPQGLGAHRPYQVLEQALANSGRWALGRVTMSGHRCAVVVRPTSGLLSAHVLHEPAQLRAAAAWQSQLREEPLSEQELQLATMLIDAAGGPVDWSSYRDDTSEQLEKLVADKLAGRKSAAPQDEPVQVIQLLEALQKSVAAAAGTPKAIARRTPKQTRRRSA